MSQQWQTLSSNLPFRVLSFHFFKCNYCENWSCTRTWYPVEIMLIPNYEKSLKGEIENSLSKKLHKDDNVSCAGAASEWCWGQIKVSQPFFLLLFSNLSLNFNLPNINFWSSAEFSCFSLLLCIHQTRTHWLAAECHVNQVRQKVFPLRASNRRQVNEMMEFCKKLFLLTFNHFLMKLIKRDCIEANEGRRKMHFRSRMKSESFCLSVVDVGTSNLRFQAKHWKVPLISFVCFLS